MGDRTSSVLFICLGNICRSPLARGVFMDLARRRDAGSRFRVDSAGTGRWHVGRPADPRSCAVAARHGIELVHVARQIDPASDFADPDAGGFARLIVMDEMNERDVLAAGAPRARVRLLRSFDPAFSRRARAPGVPDPYTGGAEGFEEVYEMVRASCAGLLEALMDPGVARGPV